MPFQYYGQYQQPGLQGINYQQPQQEQKSPFSQIDPQNLKSAYDMYTAGGLSGAGGGGGVAALGSTGGAAGVSGGSMGPVAGLAASEAGAGIGGAAGGGGSSMGSAAAAAGPWAALAAIIGVNEYNAKKGGYRSEDKGQYRKDLISGEVFHQDLEQRWLPKLGMKEGSKLNAWGSHLANPVNPLSPGKSWKRFKKLF